MTDAQRLDWLGEPSYTKSRMDNVLSAMRGREIRAAIDAARVHENEHLAEVCWMLRTQIGAMR